MDDRDIQKHLLPILFDQAEHASSSIEKSSVSTR